MAATAERHLAQGVAGDRRRGLAHLQAMVLGEVRDVHVRDGLLDRGREYPLQRAKRENPRVLSCEVALVFDLQVAWHSFTQRSQQAAQSLRDPDDQSHALAGSGRAYYSPSRWPGTASHNAASKRPSRSATPTNSRTLSLAPGAATLTA